MTIHRFSFAEPPLAGFEPRAMPSSSASSARSAGRSVPASLQRHRQPSAPPHDIAPRSASHAWEAETAMHASSIERPAQRLESLPLRDRTAAATRAANVVASPNVAPTAPPAEAQRSSALPVDASLQAMLLLGLDASGRARAVLDRARRAGETVRIAVVAAAHVQAEAAALADRLQHRLTQPHTVVGLPLHSATPSVNATGNGSGPSSTPFEPRAAGSTAAASLHLASLRFETDDLADARVEAGLQALHGALVPGGIALVGVALPRRGAHASHADLDPPSAERLMNATRAAGLVPIGDPVACKTAYADGSDIHHAFLRLHKPG